MEKFHKNLRLKYVVYNFWPTFLEGIWGQINKHKLITYEKREMIVAEKGIYKNKIKKDSMDITNENLQNLWSHANCEHSSKKKNMQKFMRTLHEEKKDALCILILPLLLPGCPKKN